MGIRRKGFFGTTETGGFVITVPLYFLGESNSKLYIYVKITV